MFGRRFEIFRVLGFPVFLDASWFLVALAGLWLFAVQIFPARHPDLAAANYWAMAVVAVLGLFGSILFHELAHCLSARHFGLPTHGITLFLFGGVAEIFDDPPSPQAEIVIAVSGPAASALLAGWLGLAGLVGILSGWPAALASVLFYLALLNVVLALFNLVPAFPLDGGRVLRALLWWKKGSLPRATQLTSRLGAAFGTGLVVWGLFLAVGGALTAGIWWALIGIFLRSAASASLRQLLLHDALKGEPVRRFMHTNPVTVPRAISVADLVEAYIYRYQQEMFPVVDDGRLVGWVPPGAVERLPRDEWPNQTVSALLQPCGPGNSVAPDADALQALNAMRRSSLPGLLVVEDNRLLGVLRLKDLLGFLSMKLKLEGPTIKA
jgi:Zn-dependent protease